MYPLLDTDSTLHFGPVGDQGAVSRKSMFARMIFALLALLALSACHRSRWVDLRIDAWARVDGRSVHASTILSRRVIDFPPANSGAYHQIKGVALALPLTPSDYVYGILRNVDRDGVVGEIEDFLHSIGGSLREHGGARSSDPGPDAPGDPAAWSDYVADRLKGQQVDVCQPHLPLPQPGSACLIFLHLDGDAAPSSLHVIKPYQLTTVGGHDIIIDRVRVTYDATDRTVNSSITTLPLSVQNGRAPFGTLPPELQTFGNQNLRMRDFLREK